MTECDGGCGALVPEDPQANGWAEFEDGELYCPDCADGFAF